MKIYPNADVSFYIDKDSCWGSYLKHGSNQHWKRPVKPFNAKHMCYWRDIEGAKMGEVKKKDLYFQNPPKSRIRRQACLGMLYATGQRFIKLSMAPPVNFKCAPLPVNLQTARLVKMWLRAKAKAKRLAKKEAKREKRAKEKAAKAYRNRGARRGKS